MVTSYIRFKTHKRGVPKEDGAMRTCMNCNKKATVTAVSKSTESPITMNVWLCERHAEYARKL